MVLRVRAIQEVWQKMSGMGSRRVEGKRVGWQYARMWA